MIDGNTIDETILTGVVRAEVSFARDNAVNRPVAFALAVADLPELPDDTLLLPAVSAALGVPTRLDDPDSREFAREVALAAGYGKLAPDRLGQS